MSHNIANTSTSTSALMASFLIVEQVKAWNLEDEDINKIYTQRVKGNTFLEFTVMNFKRWGIPDSSAKEIKKLINEIKGDLVFSGIFVIPVCILTITGLIDSMLRYSPRKCIYLPVTFLQPPSYRQEDSLVLIFKNDEITNTLVKDCGGHRRALEALNDCLASRNVEEYNINTLMNDLHYNLIKKYHDAILDSVEDARPIAQAILIRRILNRYKPILKTNKSPDEFVGSRLIRFEQLSSNSRRKYLTASYIWLWIFVEISNEEEDPLLRDWEFADYREQRALLNPISSLQAKSWQSFKNFVTLFRYIKSAVIEEDELTTISEVHVGVRLNDQLGTESLNEIHQVKLRKKAVSKKEYQEEREKSASENDFFIFFTTANCNIEILKRSGIVDRNAFMNYFGLFAGKAYRSAMANPSIYNNKVKNIYTVSLEQICNMNQISKERVNAKIKILMRNFYF
ncbi:2525_t:CDS:2 [Funneliformis caledonium]|uniref:2525_t:CDS:1 n=1 Tax=Funneliformis caledonium TaxID=1117310 RepID=A0A9N8YWT1_9GLOM|nr:2525_t:CDS:2 [Funneliformis caledonium]